MNKQELKCFVNEFLEYYGLNNEFAIEENYSDLLHPYVREYSTGDYTVEYIDRITIDPQEGEYEYILKINKDNVCSGPFSVHGFDTSYDNEISWDDPCPVEQYEKTIKAWRKI